MHPAHENTKEEEGATSKLESTTQTRITAPSRIPPLSTRSVPSRSLSTSPNRGWYDLGLRQRFRRWCCSTRLRVSLGGNVLRDFSAANRFLLARSARLVAALSVAPLYHRPACSPRCAVLLRESLRSEIRPRPPPRELSGGAGADSKREIARCQRGTRKPRSEICRSGPPQRRRRATRLHPPATPPHSARQHTDGVAKRSTRRDHNHRRRRRRTLRILTSQPSSDFARRAGSRTDQRTRSGQLSLPLFVCVRRLQPVQEHAVRKRRREAQTRSTRISRSSTLAHRQIAHEYRPRFRPRWKLNAAVDRMQTVILPRGWHSWNRSGAIFSDQAWEMRAWVAR